METKWKWITLVVLVLVVFSSTGQARCYEDNYPIPCTTSDGCAGERDCIGGRVTACIKDDPACPLPQQHIEVTLRPQETNMWCWAASGQMTMEFLGHNVNQCTQANNRFGRNDCCNTPTPNKCIKGGWPEYQKYNFTSKHTNSSALTWNQVRRELTDNRAFAFTWAWPGGGGHMMVAIGYQTVNNVKYIEINDPWAPNVGDHRFITYDFYVASQGHTHWDDYYEITYTGGH